MTRANFTREIPFSILSFVSSSVIIHERSDNDFSRWHCRNNFYVTRSVNSVVSPLSFGPHPDSLFCSYCWWLGSRHRDDVKLAAIFLRTIPRKYAWCSSFSALFSFFFLLNTLSLQLAQSSVFSPSHGTSARLERPARKWPREVVRGEELKRTVFAARLGSDSRAKKKKCDVCSGGERRAFSFREILRKRNARLFKTARPESRFRFVAERRLSVGSAFLSRSETSLYFLRRSGTSLARTRDLRIRRVPTCSSIYPSIDNNCGRETRAGM